MTRIAPTAQLASDCSVGDSTSVWDLAQIRNEAVVGAECVIGRGVYIDTGVRIGDRCKIQNNALVYQPARLADGVFIGPAAVLTNDRYPRAINPDGSAKTAGDWSAAGVRVETGASVGAAAVCLPGVTIGRYALVGAGALIVQDVPDFALVTGNPARLVRWVGKAGVPLKPVDADHWRCPVTDEEYRLVDERLRPVDELTADRGTTRPPRDAVA